MTPLYRNGDTLIVDPEAQVRSGDRVVVRTANGEIMANGAAGQTGGALATLGPIANTTIAAAAHAHVAGPQGVEGFVSIPSQGTTDTTLSTVTSVTT